MTSPVETIRRYQAELQSIRRDLHAHPELAFEEGRTSALVADKLAGWGVEVHRGLAKTGVVGVIKDARFDVPTTIARFGPWLYAVNARFLASPTPSDPYTVVRVRAH